jgi:23S rRNA (pseudouridine1915-N3)-methyltransferase
MEIKIIAVGRVRDSAYSEKISDFISRIRHDAKLEIVEIKDGTKESEGEKILEHMKKERGRMIALDEKGRFFSSLEFARHISAIPQRIIMIIGGPFGLSPAVKAAAAETVALSAMTFTHEMARMLLLEQIYRAISIINNRKYHH